MNEQLAAIRQELRLIRAELRRKLNKRETRLWSGLLVALAATVLADVLVRL
jgi:hypothetical protein